ncbi:TRAP transporter permease [[Clostridium] symbiosum]|uniref:TRAP transporter permease n=1 Tax=Clostridium symbiosum TaxID=1512 RepID=UPI0018985B80|nr:TRAP transporter permease [[Clostridium] symbiosum]MDB2020379.1 TRAP transporter permease [[Clostridium] symbiosum]
MVWKKKTADTAVPEENAEAAAGEDRDKEITEADKQELLEKFDKESKTRTFVSPAVAMAYKIFAILVTLYHLVFASGFWMPETLKHRSLHVSMILILAFAMYPATKKASRKIIAWYDYILIALSAAVPLYMWLDYFNIINRAGKPNSMDVIIGTLLTLLVLEATRRVCGMALPILGVIFILYSLMGTKQGLIPVNIPGIFLHRGYTWQKLMSHFFANTEGIYGSSVNVASTYIFLFIAFGEIMNKCGMGKFFNDIANALAGGSKGGPAKVAVVASGLLGMINGAAVAVVVTTGSFTIPLMKKTGYDNEFSGAIVATGSVGGQLMPPVMGAAAFIMAETLGIKYSTLLVSAIIPAVIYYMGILLQIQMRAEKMGMQGTPKDQLPKVGEVMKEYGHLAIPLVFLIYMLFFSGKTVIMAAFYTILFTIVVAQLRPNTRMSLNDIIDAMVASAKSTVSVAIACACVGIIVGVCSITGFALNMASTIIQIGGQSLMFTLMFTMVTCMILGMGLPSIPSYIITSTIAAPALVTLGIPPIAAHMFCFYFAMFANLTPPVALAAFAAAGIAGGSPMKTGWASVKLALAGFILPYMFVYNTELLLLDTPIAKGIQVAITAAIGVFLISVAVEGFLFRKINAVLRILCFAGAYLLIDSGLITDIIGIAICVGIVLLQKTMAKKHGTIVT